MADAYVKTEFHKGIATIEFFHPRFECRPVFEPHARIVLAVGGEQRHPHAFDDLDRIRGLDLLTILRRIETRDAEKFAKHAR